ncbi:hypothetical protein [Thalassiella azotivora]
MGTWRAHWLTVALVVVVVADVVLVTLALRGPASPDRSGTLSGDAQVAASPTQTPVPTPVPTETGPPPPPAGAPTNRLLDVVSDQAAWRAVVGSCPAGGSTVQRTDDGGLTWEDAGVDLPSVVRLKADAASTAFVVGQDAEDCEPAFSRTTGEDWRRSASSLEVAWFVSPSDRTTVSSPAGAFPGPCGGPLVDVAPVTSDEAAALCPDGSVHLTQDGAATWSPVAAVPGAVALTDQAGGYLVAVAGDPTCAGLVVTRIGAEDAPQPVACAPASGTPAEVALSAADDAVWLWAGDAVLRSDDGGVTWDDTGDGQ